MAITMEEHIALIIQIGSGDRGMKEGSIAIDRDK